MRNYPRIVIFGLMLIALCAGCGDQRAEYHEPADFGGAREQLVDHRFDLADSVFAALALNDSTMSWGKLGRGIVLESQLQLWEAVVQYYSIIDEAPEFTPAYEATARVLINLGWPGKASGVLKMGLENRGDDEALIPLLAEALIVAHHSSAALRVISNGVDDPQGQVALLWLKAAALRMSGDLTGAQQAVQSAASQATTDPIATNAAALYYESAGQLDSAMIFSRLVAEGKGWTPLALTEHFGRTIRLADYREAREIIERVPDDSSCATLKNILKIKYHLARRESVQAFILNRVYQQQARETFSGEACNFEVKSRLSDNISAEHNIEIIEQLITMDQYPTAFKELVSDQILIWFPQLRLPKESHKRLSKIDPQRPVDQELDLLSIYIKLAAGDFENYEIAKKDYVSKYAGSAEDLTRLADLIGQKSSFYDEGAIKFYHEILKESPGFEPAFVGLSNLLIRLQRFKEAAEIFESYPEIPKDNPLLICIQATVLAETSLESEGWQLLKPVMSRLGGNMFSIERFLQALWKTDQQELSKDVIKEMVRLWPENPDCLAIAAEFSALYGDYSDALTLAQQATGLPYADRSGRIQQAYALYNSGQKREALQLFEELSGEVEADPELDLFFSRVLATGNLQPRKAANLARGSVVEGRRTLRAFLNLCYVYSQQKRVDLSVGQARQAVNLFPNHPRALFALGKAAYLQKRDEARNFLSKAVSNGLRGELLEEANQMLSKL